MKWLGRTSLFVLGLALGGIGMSIADKNNLLREFRHAQGITQKSPALADACVPKNAQDDIFFVSCGGIY